MFSSVGGATYVYIVEICRVLAMAFICSVNLLAPVGVFWWFMQSIWMAQLSNLGSNLNSCEIRGST